MSTVRRSSDRNHLTTIIPYVFLLKTNTMKTSIITLCMFLGVTSMAQVLTNPDFEIWTVTTLYEDPTYHITANSQLYAAGESSNAIKSSDATAGSYSLRLETVEAMGDTVPGMAIMGIAGPGGIGGGEPYTDRPDSITGMIKYDIQPLDTAMMLVMFTEATNPIGMAAMQLYGSQTAWTFFSGPIQWFSGSNPDTVFALISSSVLDGNKMPGSWLMVDDLQFKTGVAPYPNGSFENWTSVTSEEADGWFSMNYASASGPSVTKTTDSYNGTYAMSIVNIETQWGDTMGVVTNGLIGANGPEGGVAIWQNPDKLTGYYKYAPVGLDTALAGLFTFRYDSGLDSTMLIEELMVHLPATATYTYFEVQLTYNGWPYIDTVNVAFASGNLEEDTNYVGLGSELIIDELELILHPVGVKEQNQSTLNIYPNPTTGVFVIEHPFENEYPELLLLDVAGNIVGQSNYRINRFANRIELDLGGLASGIYVYELITETKGIYAGTIVLE